MATGKSEDMADSMQYGSTLASTGASTDGRPQSPRYRTGTMSPSGDTETTESLEDKPYIPSALDKQKVSLVLPTVPMDTDFEDVEELSFGGV